jgi:hypothetical protein
MEITATASLGLREETKVLGSSSPEQVLVWYTPQHDKCLFYQCIKNAKDKFLLNQELTSVLSINACRVHTGWYTGTLPYFYWVTAFDSSGTLRSL